MDDRDDVAERLRTGLRRVIVGADEPVFAALVALLAGGHLLVEGVPGTAKTLLVRTLARLIGGEFRRIQFTPDLMPADVVGTSVFDQRDGSFSVRFGPIFANVVLADEINRTPPKTQSALLEAMEERRVTIDGVTTPLPMPFLVAATQNPIEFEGTYPLPEAQLDRFLVRARSGYPTPAEERALLARVVAGFDARDLAAVEPVVTLDALLAAQERAARTHVEDAVVGYIYDIVAATRASSDLALGASPRAGIGLVAAARVAAYLDGRDFVTPDDVKDVAVMVLAHRMIVQPEAEIDGVTTEIVVKRILDAVDVPALASP
jgi:MoxR-like ATPase